MSISEKKKFLVPVVMSFVFSALLLPAYANLISNPSFEKGSGSQITDWRTLVWNNGDVEFKIVDNIAHSGSKALAIINKDRDMGSCSQVIRVTTGRTYKFSCWIKTEYVGTDPGVRGAYLSVNTNAETSIAVAGSDPVWVLAELYIVMESENNKNTESTIVVHLNLGHSAGLNTGTAYFDEAELVEVAEIPENSRITKITAVPEQSTSTEKKEGIFVDSTGRESEKRTLTILILFVIVIILVVSGRAFYRSIRDTRRPFRKTHTKRKVRKHKNGSLASRLRRLNNKKSRKFKHVAPKKKKAGRVKKGTGRKSKSA